jgi:hypothetical protein
MVRIVVLEDGSWGPLHTAEVHTISDNQLRALIIDKVNIRDLRSTGFPIVYRQDDEYDFDRWIETQ